MQELMRNAMDGFTAYTAAGKYAVLLFGALIWYWYQVSVSELCEFEKPVKKIMLYTMITVVLVLCPVTAALLMKYQTRFYDYKWLWSIVPVTSVIAYAAASVYLGCCRDRWKGKCLVPAGFALLGLAVIFLCGNLNTSSFRGNEAAESRRKTVALLDKLEETGDTETVCLWAPEEILTHVREVNGHITLLYGRNMWEPALNAYAYDVYAPEIVELYDWMEAFATQDGSEQELSGKEKQSACAAIETALNKGVNCMIIPIKKSEDLLDCVTDAAGKRHLSVTGDTAEGYDIYWIRP